MNLTWTCQACSVIFKYPSVCDPNYCPHCRSSDLVCIDRLDSRGPGKIEIDAAERASAASRNTLGHIEKFLKDAGRNDLYLHTLGRVQLLTETLMHREHRSNEVAPLTANPKNGESTSRK